MLQAELLIVLYQITEWRDHQIGLYHEEAEQYVHSEKLAIDIHVSITIDDYNQAARVTIQGAHVRIQTETHAAIMSLEAEYSIQVRAIADRLRELNNPYINGWDQRPGYCRRTYGSFFDTKDIRKGSANSDATSCAVQCEGDAECYAFFLGNDNQCNLWINVDISVNGEDMNDGCFHLNNCYVRLNLGHDGSLDVPFTMGGATVPAGYRDVCMDELVDDVALWRAAKEHLNVVAVNGGYLNRVGQYVERREGALVGHDASYLYVSEDYLPKNANS